MPNNKTLTNDEAAREIAKLTARLNRKGRKDLANALIATAQQHLSK